MACATWWTWTACATSRATIASGRGPADAAGGLAALARGSFYVREHSAAHAAAPAGIPSSHQSIPARASNRALILAVWVWLSRRMVMTTKAVVIAGFRKRLDQFFPAAVVASLQLIK